jgi:hypothetical protein
MRNTKVWVAKPARPTGALVGSGFRRRPVFLMSSIPGTRLEMHHNAGGEAEVILPGVEEAGLQGIGLESPANSLNQLIVDASAQGIGE